LRFRMRWWILQTLLQSLLRPGLSPP